MTYTNLRGEVIVVVQRVNNPTLWEMRRDTADGEWLGAADYLQNIERQLARAGYTQQESAREDNVNERTITRAKLAAEDKNNAGNLFDWDNWGYEIAYYIEERNQLTGDCLCGGCATAFLNGLDEDDNETGVYPAFQINGEIGDEASVYCNDCGGIIYAGADLDYDKSNAA